MFFWLFKSLRQFTDSYLNVRVISKNVVSIKHLFSICVKQSRLMPYIYIYANDNVDKKEILVFTFKIHYLKHHDIIQTNC